MAQLDCCCPIDATGYLQEIGLDIEPRYGIVLVMELTAKTGIISTITEAGHPERITRIVRTANGQTIKQVSQGLVEGTTDQYYWWNIDIR